MTILIENNRLIQRKIESESKDIRPIQKNDVF